MSEHAKASIIDKIRQACGAAAGRFNIAAISDERIQDLLANAVDPRRLVDNLAEAWRVSPDEVRSVLADHGLGGILARLGPDADAATAGDEARGEPLADRPLLMLGDGAARVRAFNPAFDEPVAAGRTVLDSVGAGVAAFLPSAGSDPLGVLYRDGPLQYAEAFLATDAPRIDAYLKEHFGGAGPRYLVNSGIGANEQFNYFVSALANARPDRPCTWLLANSPKAIADLPPDASVDNTLFMEFSRSGITEETVKLHEFTPRAAKRIVFANAGSLRELGERDGNLVLELPSDVSGRYGRNKTPILMAPMYVAGLDVRAHWKIIDDTCRAWDLSERTSPPVVLAQYLRLQQLRRGVNHVYLGTNDPVLRYSADEFCQYWNEGVNRDGNDITMSRYLGLPRDSHMNLEAILGTSEHKLAVFLLRTGEPGRHALLADRADPINPDHADLTPGETDLILALANVRRCSEKMPTVLITVDRVDLTASAVLGQFWADTTLVYSRLIGVNPGSNPEVKVVRTRAAEWLGGKAQAFSMLNDAPGG